MLIGSNNTGKVREIEQLLPRYIRVSSIIDYKLTLTLPKRTSADTGIDALTHAMEAYISKKANKKPVVTVFLKDDKIELIRPSPKESLTISYYIKKIIN